MIPTVRFYLLQLFTQLKPINNAHTRAYAVRFHFFAWFSSLLPLFTCPFFFVVSFFVFFSCIPWAVGNLDDLYLARALWPAWRFSIAERYSLCRMSTEKQREKWTEEKHHIYSCVRADAWGARAEICHLPHSLYLRVVSWHDQTFTLETFMPLQPLNTVRHTAQASELMEKEAGNNEK